jgi:DNA-binding IclR family transcriptional regulator
MVKRKPLYDRTRLRQVPPKPANSVKSAMRVLEILEFFDDIQAEATVLEVARALEYPQSSTSALLRTLHSSGYLHHDPRKRTYVTSVRAAILGSWVGANFAREGRIIELMRRLNAETGDTILLASRNGLYSQYIHVVQATSAARLHLSIGTVRPLVTSGTGYVFLGALSDAEVFRIVNRSNAENLVPGGVVAREVLAEVERARKLGYAFSLNRVTPGAGVLAAALLRLKDQPMLVLGIGGISSNMTQNKDQLIEALQRHIGEYHLRAG